MSSYNLSSIFAYLSPSLSAFFTDALKRQLGLVSSALVAFVVVVVVAKVKLSTDPRQKSSQSSKLKPKETQQQQLQQQQMKLLQKIKN